MVDMEQRSPSRIERLSCNVRCEPCGCTAAGMHCGLWPGQACCLTPPKTGLAMRHKDGYRCRCANTVPHGMCRHVSTKLLERTSSDAAPRFIWPWSCLCRAVKYVLVKCRQSITYVLRLKVCCCYWNNRHRSSSQVVVAGGCVIVGK